MSKYTNAIKTLAKLKALDAGTAEKLLNAHVENDGGPGSGNFGHAGRPGKRGGSSKESGSGSVAESTGKPSSGLKYPKGAPEIKSSAKPASQKTANKPIETDPTGEKLSAKHKDVKKEQLSKANMEQADKCFYAKNDEMFQNEPKALKQLKIWEEILSKPLPGRPTPEESQKEIEKKLSNISPKLKPYFREVYEKRLRDEPHITKDICDICDDIGAEMYGLDHRLKGAKDALNEETGEMECRSAEKIEEDMKEKGWTYEEAVDNFSDMVRYTQACTVDNLVDNFEKTKAALEKKGYKFAKVKNTWESFNEKNPYRGVNCVVVSPNGTRFELQFQTPESMVGKEVQHPWYEEGRSPNVKPERKSELNRKMYENMRRMKPPKNIERIANYPPKGYD